VLLDAAVWLRDNTPPTDSPLSPGARPEYGILAPWGFGHLLKYVAQRPTVVGNFGDDVGEGNLRRVTAYFASREPDAVRILDDLRARYVLVQTLGDVPDARLHGEAMRKRLSVDDSPGLAHHRLLYESLLDSERMQLGRSEFRIFERVAGALVEGRAPPGAVVTARLAYQSNRGRRGRFETRAVADAAGRYALRLPYSTRGAPPGVRTEPSYALTAASAAGVALEAAGVGEDAAPGRLVVSEADVRSGALVAGPDFAAP
jgi:asparagine N-glycosylation enzyme membrane subunit Stt3